jgi:hypothetical protein
MVQTAIKGRPLHPLNFEVIFLFIKCKILQAQNLFTKYQFNWSECQKIFFFTFYAIILVPFFWLPFSFMAWKFFFKSFIKHISAS